MTTLTHTLLAATLALATPAPPAEQDVSGEIQAAIRDWRSSEGASADRLTRRLVKLGPRAAPILGGMLGGRRDGVLRAAFAAALGKLGAPGSVAHLVPALQDADARVHSAASRALLELARPPSGIEIVRPLRAALEDAQRKERVACVLGLLEDPAARSALYELLTHWHDERDVLAGLCGLWSTADERDGERALALLRDTDARAVLKKASVLLGRIGYRPAVGHLLPLLRAADRGVAADAYWALARITGVRLRPDPQLWELWWERTGRAEFGPNPPS